MPWCVVEMRTLRTFLIQIAFSWSPKSNPNSFVPLFVSYLASNFISYDFAAFDYARSSINSHTIHQKSQATRSDCPYRSTTLPTIPHPSLPCENSGKAVYLYVPSNPFAKKAKTLTTSICQTPPSRLSLEQLRC